MNRKINRKGQIKTMNRVQAVNLSKKGQIKMAENLTIMFVFFILIVLALVFYFKLTKHTTLVEQEKYRELDAIKVSEKTAFLPEVRCSQENVLVPDCFDKLRIKSAEPIFRNNTRYYFEIFSYAKITAFEIYPDKSETVLYDFAPEGDYDEIPTQVPISLFDPTKQEYSFGILEVRLYVT